MRVGDRGVEAAGRTLSRLGVAVAMTVVWCSPAPLSEKTRRDANCCSFAGLVGFSDRRDGSGG